MLHWLSSRVAAGWTFAGFLLLFTLIPATSAHAANPRELILLTWEEYLDADVAAEFEAEHNAKIRQIHFESDNDRDLLLVQNEGMGFDLALLDTAVVTVYDQMGWLAPMGEKEVANLRHIDPALWIDYPQFRDRAAPYMRGTMGIIYRTDLVAEPLTSWMQLLRPAAALRGKIMMIKDPYELVATAMKALGHPMMSEDEAHLDEAEKLLQAQKPHVYRYGYFSYGPQSELVTGRVAAAQGYNGDYYSLLEEQENLAYVIPREGGGLWADSWVLLKSARNPELALKFLDFLNRPEVAARNAEGIYYASCNTAARAHHPREFLDDEVIFPPPSETLSRSEHYRLPSAKAAGRYNALLYGLIE